MSDLTRPLRRFLDWWMGELRGIVPATWRYRSGRRTTCRLLIAEGSVAIERITSGSAERYEDSSPFDQLDEESLEQLAQLSGGQVALILGEPEVFALNIQLPKAARSRVRPAVGLRLTDRAPVMPDLLTWMITREVMQADVIAVDVVMARSERIEAICERLATFGVTVSGVSAQTSHGEFPFPRPLDIVAGIKEWAESRLTLVICAGLILSIPLTSWAAASVLAVRAEWQLYGMADEVREIRAGRRDAEEREAERRLLMPTAQQPGAAAILNAVAGALPPTDWLRAVERHPDGSLLLVVVTRDEEQLDDSLRKSPLLPDARVTDRTPLDDGTVEIIYQVGRP